MMKISVQLVAGAWSWSLRANSLLPKSLRGRVAQDLLVKVTPACLGGCCLQRAVVTTPRGSMATASHCYFISSQFWKSYFLNFLAPTVCDILQCLVQSRGVKAGALTPPLLVVLADLSFSLELFPFPWLYGHDLGWAWRNDARKLLRTGKIIFSSS